MKLSIIGSGGCVSIPKPMCQCNVCSEAREKGYPYKRTGCSIYLEDIALLVDTPENIVEGVNHLNVKKINHILYSHWHPDHTLGMRIVEQLGFEWIDYYEGKKVENPIEVIAQEFVMEDLLAIENKEGSYLKYYEDMGLIKLNTIKDSFVIDNIKVTIVLIDREEHISIFTFESDGKKIVYAPCDCVPFPVNELINDADYLILGSTIIGDKLKKRQKD